jgi:C4-dicarboxylate transporter DctQ subunit
MLAWWDRIERWLIGVLGAFGLGIYLTQIIGRYIAPDANLAWGEELTIYVIIWATFLTASQLVREDGHVRADLLLRMMPVTRQRWVEIANCIIAVAFCAALAWFGYLAARDSFELGEVSNTILAFPLWIYYAALPTSALLMSIRYLLRLWQFCFRFDPAHMAVQSGRES